MLFCSSSRSVFLQHILYIIMSTVYRNQSERNMYNDDISEAAQSPQHYGMETHVNNQNQRENESEERAQRSDTSQSSEQMFRRSHEDEEARRQRDLQFRQEMLELRNFMSGTKESFLKTAPDILDGAKRVRQASQWLLNIYDAVVDQKIELRDEWEALEAERSRLSALLSENMETRETNSGLANIEQEVSGLGQTIANLAEHLTKDEPTYQKLAEKRTSQYNEVRASLRGSQEREEALIREKERLTMELEQLKISNPSSKETPATSSFSTMQTKTPPSHGSEELSEAAPVEHSPTLNNSQDGQKSMPAETVRPFSSTSGEMPAAQASTTAFSDQRSFQQADTAVQRPTVGIPAATTPVAASQNGTQLTRAQTLEERDDLSSLSEQRKRGRSTSPLDAIKRQTKKLQRLGSSMSKSNKKSTPRRQSTAKETLESRSMDEIFDVLAMYDPSTGSRHPATQLQPNVRSALEPSLEKFTIGQNFQRLIMGAQKEAVCAWMRLERKSNDGPKALQTCKCCKAAGRPCIIVEKGMPPTLVPRSPEDREGLSMDYVGYWKP